MADDWVFAPLQRKHYRVIVADPPWKWLAWSSRGDGRSASNHYRIQTVAELESLPVAELCAEDCVMFMWVIQPMLPEALALMNSWGFKFKTVGFAWVKTTNDGRRLRIGTGYHTRSSFEQCWIGTKGKGYERADKGVKQVLFAPRREHSRKPDEAMSRIERLTGDVPRVELFSRSSRPGWDTWGDEAGLFDGGENAGTKDGLGT